MRILHVGMGLMPAISRELAKIGPYRFIDWTGYMDLGVGAKDLLRRDILKNSEQFKPDVTFLHIQRPGVITQELACLLTGFVINYTYDVVLPIPQWYMDIGAHIDTTIFCDEKGVFDFRAMGYESDFMHVGYDHLVFRPNGSVGDYGDIVFLGNHYSDKQMFDLTKFRYDMVDQLKTVYGDRFKVYGNGWRYNDGNLMYREAKEAECYRSCKIAINVSHFDLERYTSDRMFRIMGSGGFCLTKWYPGIEKDFTDGVHVRVWKDLDELQTLVDYYLENEDERLAIASAGNKYVSEKLTWENRIKSIVDMARARMSKEYKSRVKVAQPAYHKNPETGHVMNSPMQIPTKDDLANKGNSQIETLYVDPSTYVPQEVTEPVLPLPAPVMPPLAESKSVVTSINGYFDKIYCINLDRRTDRWEQSTREFEKNGLTVERVSAIDGNMLGVNRYVNKWEQGCYQSHMAVLQKIVENGYARTLVLEDDIEFIPNVQDYFVRSVKFIPANWKMLYFGGNHINPPLQINPVIGKINRTYTTGAYGVTAAMAKSMLDYLLKHGISMQIDVAYSNLQRSGDCYTFSPKIAWQRPGFSDIQQGMQDYTGIIR
jgi:spore maturation protein CgeB